MGSGGCGGEAAVMYLIAPSLAGLFDNRSSDPTLKRGAKDHCASGAIIAAD